MRKPGFFPIFRCADFWEPHRPEPAGSRAREFADEARAGCSKDLLCFAAKFRLGSIQPV